MAASPRRGSASSPKAETSAAAPQNSPAVAAPPAAAHADATSACSNRGTTIDIALVEVGVRCSLEQMLSEGFYHAGVLRLLPCCTCKQQLSCLATCTLDVLVCAAALLATNLLFTRPPSP